MPGVISISQANFVYDEKQNHRKSHFWHKREIAKFEGQPYCHFPLEIHETALVSIPYYFDYTEFFLAPQICLLLSYGLTKLVMRDKKSNVKTSHMPSHEL